MDSKFPILPSIFISILFIFLILKIMRKISTNRSTNLPPGPAKLPIIGNLHNLVGSLPHRALSQLAHKYGPVMHLQLGELSTVVISSPDTARTVLKTLDAIFAQRPRILALHVMSYESTDIASSHGKYWRDLRKLCTTELLSAKRVKSFRSLREEEAARLVESIRALAGVPFSLSKKIFSSTYGFTARAAFGGRCARQEEFIACIEEFTEVGSGFGPADVFPSVKFLHFISNMRRRVENLHHRFDTILESIIDEHKAKRRGRIEDRLDNVDVDLVDVLLNIQENGDLDFPLTTNNIKAVIFDIFSAGSDTSSTTVEWAMSEMIKNPRVMEKVQEEVRRVYANVKGVIDESRLEELVFLKCVVKETLRLHPALPLLVPRECQEQCRINGYDIPMKTRVIVNAWAIGRDSGSWDEPERFYPERFVDNRVDYKGTSFEYVPFGAGRRICPGIAFAMPNVELPLANLVYHFDWSVGGVKNEELDMSEGYGISVRREKDLCLVATPYDQH